MPRTPKIASQIMVLLILDCPFSRSVNTIETSCILKFAPVCPVFHLDLKGIAYKTNQVQIQCFKHPRAYSTQNRPLGRGSRIPVINFT